MSDYLRDLELSERLALQKAVDEARADPRARVPHEQVRAEMLEEIERIRRNIAKAS